MYGVDLVGVGKSSKITQLQLGGRGGAQPPRALQDKRRGVGGQF